MPRGNSYYYQFGRPTELKANRKFTRTGPPKIAACAARDLACKAGIDVPLPQFCFFPQSEKEVEVTLHVFLPENHLEFEKI